MIFRPRRLRKTAAMRSLIRETVLSPDDFVAPLFVMPGKNKKKEILSMPGQYQMSVEEITAEVKSLWGLGVKSIILFGIPDKKDAMGSRSWAEDGIIQNAVKAVKNIIPEMIVITDVCLCEYTDHGHCGIIKDNDVNNDATVELLVKQAISHAAAGADIIAPSDMMDGRVRAIRNALDQESYTDIAILAYSAKYASAFYGPFRDAAGSAPAFGDRKSYQMDPANSREAIKEVLLDIDEGADMVMVKPALAYLDIIKTVKEVTNLPVGAYNVSGEYSMIKAAARLGWLDEQKVMMESLISIKRAGADIILTYFAKDAAKILGE